MFNIDQAQLDNETTDWIRRFVHPTYGLIQRMVYVPTGPRFRAFLRCVSYTGHSCRLCGDGSYKRTAEPGRGRGLGFSTNVTKACRASIAEALERYAAGIYYDDEMLSARGQDISASGQLVSRMILKEEPILGAQERYVRYDPMALYRWTPVRKAGTSSCANAYWVPSHLIWFGYRPRFANERIGPITSNGVAAGVSLYHALCSAALEIIERDSVMCYWFLGAAPRKIRYDSDVMNILPSAMNDALDRGTGAVEVNFLLLDNEFNIPVIFALFIDECASVVGVGASASFDTVTALRKAAHEALLSYMDQISRQENGIAPSPITKRTEPVAHIDFYRSKSRWDALSFLRKGCKLVSIQSCKNPQTDCGAADARKRWASVVRALNEKGYDAYYVDMTRDDVREARHFVARVLVPGLQPLLFGPYVPADIRRLKVFSERNLCGQVCLNKAIHPFP